MAKQGRPGVPYEKFTEVWENLIKEGRAGTNTAHDLLGGSKSTIASYRERYEREQTSKTLSLIKSLELPDALLRSIAEIKVHEIEVLEKDCTQLKSRADEYLNLLKELEEKLAIAKVELDDTTMLFNGEKLKLEKKLAAAEARIEDIEAREQKINDRYEKLHEQYSLAKEAVAASQKEVQMLREQLNSKSR